MPTAITNGNINSAVNAWCNPAQNASATATYGHISTWDVSQVTLMNYLFYNKSTFNDDISNWDTSAVTNMDSIFRGASLFNQDIGSWNTGNVTNMKYMFSNAYAFNQDIGTKQVTPEGGTTYTAWNTGKVENMSRMFYMQTSGISVFDQEIRGWDVDEVTNFFLMFTEATAFFNTYGNEPGYGTTPTAAFFTLPPPPPSAICFPKGTPVLTNLGDVAIEKLNPDQHTIRGKEIVAITQSRPLQKHIVCFEKDSFK